MKETYVHTVYTIALSMYIQYICRLYIYYIYYIEGFNAHCQINAIGIQSFLGGHVHGHVSSLCSMGPS